MSVYVFVVTYTLECASENVPSTVHSKNNGCMPVDVFAVTYTISCAREKFKLSYMKRPMNCVCR